MYDKELVSEILQQIFTAIERVEFRFTPVATPDFFLETEEGLEKLDAICMALIAIGESLKNIDKITDQSLLSKYPSINWKQIKGMRDVISHHYFDIDAEAVFQVCKSDIAELKQAIIKIKNEI